MAVVTVAGEAAAADAMVPGEAGGSDDGTPISPRVVAPSREVALGELGGVEDGGGDRRGVEAVEVVPESEGALQGDGDGEDGGENGDTSRENCSGDAGGEVAAAGMGQEAGVDPAVEGDADDELIEAGVPQDKGRRVEGEGEKVVVEVGEEGGEESQGAAGMGYCVPLEAATSVVEGSGGVRASDAEGEGAVCAVGGVSVVGVPVVVGDVAGEFVSGEFSGALESDDDDDDDGGGGGDDGDDDDQQVQQSDRDGPGKADTEEDASGELGLVGGGGDGDERGGGGRQAGGAQKGEAAEEDGVESNASPALLGESSVDVGGGGGVETSVEGVLAAKKTDGARRDRDVDFSEAVGVSESGPGSSGRVEDGGSTGEGGLLGGKKEQGGIVGGTEEEDEDDEEVPSAEELTAKFLEVAVRTFFVFDF